MRCAGYHGTSPLSQVLQDETNRQVREQLDLLPECYKVPLKLRYYKCMSYSDIARTFNRRLPTVKTIIFRAKNRLRRNLGQLNKAKVQDAAADSLSEQAL